MAGQPITAVSKLASAKWQAVRSELHVCSQALPEDEKKIYQAWFSLLY